MIVGLAMPALALFALAVLVARLAERVVPETPFGLVLQVAIASGTMVVISAVAFALLYANGAAPIARSLAARPGAGMAYFLVLRLKAALIWAPPVLLVVVPAPRRWKHERW